MTRFSELFSELRNWAPLRSAAAAALALLFLAVPASAQVSLNPTGVFLSNHDRYTSISISNSSHTPQEVEIGFQFSYPTTTETGEAIMVRNDAQKQANYDMAPYLSVYPNRFVLAPGRTQTVRVFVDAGGALPPELQSGVRWARLVTTSVPQTQGPFMPVKAGESQAQVKVGISQVTAVIYRGGQGQSELDMGTARVGRVGGDGMMAVLVPFDHRGDAPFWGTAKVKLIDQSGDAVASFTRRTAIYEDMVLAVGAGKLTPDRVPPGTYQAEISITPRRADVPEEYRSKVEPFGRKMQLTVPAP